MENVPASLRRGCKDAKVGDLKLEEFGDVKEDEEEGEGGRKWRKRDRNVGAMVIHSKGTDAHLCTQ